MKKMIMNVLWIKRDGWKIECKGNLFLVNSSWMKNKVGIRSMNNEIRKLNKQLNYFQIWNDNLQFHWKLWRWKEINICYHNVKECEITIKHSK
jgi:hypothetical protein